jgi:hypothetical protein
VTHARVPALLLADDPARLPVPEVCPGQADRREITLFSMWYELRWGITACVLLTLSLITVIF